MTTLDTKTLESRCDQLVSRNANVPSGMVEVSKDLFFATLFADRRDIMPRHSQRNYTTWETKSREVWGWSTPGWANPGDPKRYAIRKVPS